MLMIFYMVKLRIYLVDCIRKVLNKGGESVKLRLVILKFICLIQGSFGYLIIISHLCYLCHLVDLLSQFFFSTYIQKIYVMLLGLSKMLLLLCRTFLYSIEKSNCIRYPFQYNSFLSNKNFTPFRSVLTEKYLSLCYSTCLCLTLMPEDPDLRRFI